MAQSNDGGVRQFMEAHFRHFNAREMVDAARAYAAHVDAGGTMMVTLAGAMSTAEIGRSLAPLIRAGKVHAITCTGANLEEDVFNLLARDEYESCPQWRSLSAEDEQALLQRGMNRVTDTCIPETVMRHLEARLLGRWQAACADGTRQMPSEYVADVLRDDALAAHYQADPAHSWVLAAMQCDVPVFTPGWEDSTTANMFAAAVTSGALPHHQCVITGTEQMQRVMQWYLDNCGLSENASTHASNNTLNNSTGVGFFQVGGGIAGDFSICAVPTLVQDLKRDDVPCWQYFCQITDAIASYGGYSGAVPNEKITWGKLDVNTPRFMIQSDASIVAPLMFAYLLDA